MSNPFIKIIIKKPACPTYTHVTPHVTLPPISHGFTPYMTLTCSCHVIFPPTYPTHNPLVTELINYLQSSLFTPSPKIPKFHLHLETKRNPNNPKSCSFPIARVVFILVFFPKIQLETHFPETENLFP